MVRTLTAAPPVQTTPADRCDPPARAGLMPHGTTFRTWDDYFIPDTSVLRNKLGGPGQPHGETDPAKLQQIEEAATAVRIGELRANPVVGRFDYDHMKAIHGYVFQDVYEWAGQERVAPAGQFMTKEGHAYYGAGPHLTAAAEAQYAKLAAKDHLRGLGRAEFVDELAEAWGELNTGGSALSSKELFVALW